MPESQKGAWVAPGSILLLGAAGETYYQAVYLPGQTSSEPALQTAVARQGDLVIYASGSGTRVSADQVGLAFTTGWQGFGGGQKFYT